MTKALVLAALLLAARTAAADPELAATADPLAPDGRHLAYVELLGKAGAYGVGYELALTPHVALGVEGSYVRLRDQTIATAVPYLHVTPWRRGGNALFGELGLELTESKIRSDVMRWSGTSTDAIGGVAAAGYERTFGHVVLRGAVSLLAGKGGMTPWAGVAIGVRP